MASEMIWTAKEQQKIDEAIDAFRDQPGSLIPLLQEVQALFGYLPIKAMEHISKVLRIPQAEIFGVATFYAHFYLSRRGDHMVKVCLGTACHVRGARNVLETAQYTLGIKAGETTEDYKYSLERVACLGSCALAPVMVVDDQVHRKVSPKVIMDMFSIGGDIEKENDKK